MATVKTSLDDTVINLVSDQTLGNGVAYTIQNTGSGVLWLGAYAALPTAAVLRADAHILLSGEKGAMTVDTAVPVYAVAMNKNPTQITITEA